MTSTIPSNQTTTAAVDNSTSYTISTGWSSTDIQTNLMVRGDAEFEGDIVVKGRSLTERLSRIEERLAILPPPNQELDRDWERLAELRRQYVELERKLLEQQQVFDILKKSG